MSKSKKARQEEEKRKYNEKVEKNQADLKRDLQTMKQIFIDVPFRIIKPIAQEVGEVIGNVGDAVNIFDKTSFTEAITNLFMDFDLYKVGKVISGLKSIKQDTEKYDKEYQQAITRIERKYEEMKRNNTKSKSTTKESGYSKSQLSRTKLSSTNHPEWYMRDKTMLNNLVGINVSNRQNADTDYIVTFDTDAGISSPNVIGGYKTYGIPSCASIDMELTIPKSNTQDWFQGINMLYKNIRSANAGAVNYSPAQLADYVLTIRSIDVALSTLGRAIKTINTGTFYDALSPQSMFAAMGMDYDSFAANAANARELYSRLAAIRYRLMPLNISLLDRARWLFSNIFKDSDDAKAQLYVPMTQRAMFIEYIDGSRNIEYATIAAHTLDESATGIKWDLFSSEIISLFTSFQNNGVFQIIAGDVLKAYGKESLNSYPPIVMDSTLQPVYDIHILTQIQNASLSVTGSVLTTFDNEENLDKFLSMNVYENINYDPEAGVSFNTQVFPLQAEELNRWLINPTYNTNQNETDAGRLLSSTRLMVSRKATNATTNAGTAVITYDTYGTEVCNQIYVILTSPKAYPTSIANLGAITVPLLETISLVADYGIAVGMVPVWSWFDYFPFVIPVILDAVHNKVGYCPPLFDFNNFGIAYKSNLDSYNAICTLSMLHKPFVARVNKVEVFEN